MKKLNLRLKKIFISLFLVLVCFVGLFGIGLKANASENHNVRQEIILNINNNDNTHEWFALFSINGYSTSEFNTDFSLLGFSYYEGQDYVENKNHYLYLNRVQGDEYALYHQGQNTNISLYSSEIYLMAYLNSTKKIYIYALTYNRNNGVFEVGNSIYNNFLVYEFYVDWRSGQLTEYTNKRLYLYGQTIQLSQADSEIIPNNSNYNNYLNAVLGVYFRNSYLGDIINNYYSLGDTNGYRRGYDSGYNLGYAEGQTGENAISPIWNVLTGIFNSVGAILSIELIPHIPIGLLIFVPLFFIMVMAILSIWRKNW